MHRIHTQATRTVLTALVIALAISLMSAAQSNQPPERFTAFAMSLEGGVAGASVVEMNVKRWSSEAERQTLLGALKKGGADALLEAVRDTPSVGTIRTPDSIAYDLRYSYQEPLEDGGRRIILGTDRPINFWEAANQPRSIQYPFTVIEIHVPREGAGEGKLSVATRITATGRSISLENFATTPVQLRDVKATRP